MEDPQNIGSKKYEAAPRPVQTKWEETVIKIQSAYLLLKAMFVYFIDCCKDFSFASKSKDIHGQLALVTGGANGLGREISIELAKEGCNLAIVDLNMESAQQTCKEISENYNVKTKPFKCDVSDYEAVGKLKEEVEKSMGFVDILVNNAGLLTYISVCEGSHKDIEKIVDVNVNSIFWTTRVFLDGMIQRKRGHIVSVSSIAGFLPFPRNCVYSATKFAVRGFMKSLHHELNFDGHGDYIRTTTLYPPAMTTRYETKKLSNFFGKLFVFFDPSDVAKKLVDGIKKNKIHVTFPFEYHVFLKIGEIIPDGIWQLFMKYSIQNYDKKLSPNI